MITEAYQETYDHIASDHVSFWHQNDGRNPFQDPTVMWKNEQATLELIRDYAPHGPMLDVGCGMGDLLDKFPRRMRRGVDISEDYLKIARKRGLKVMKAAAESLPFVDGLFEVVIATDILEHVFDLNQVTRELVRVSRKFIIVRVPCMENVFWDSPPYKFVHVRIFDEGTLRLLFDPIMGCRVRECFQSENVLHLVAQK
jgi:ubiquinone/menaquinone biosynthesis C-methylase UbiE